MQHPVILVRIKKIADYGKCFSSIDNINKIMYNYTMNNTLISYRIKWFQTYNNWEPVELPITDFTQAMDVINAIRSKR